MIKFIIAVLGLLTLVRAFPSGLDDRVDAGVCGYDSCPVPKPGMLNVHLVPHTHDDVGWLKTVDQYYFGSRTSIQNAGVQYIIDSVVYELLHDPKKKFIYVETAFFWKWWKEQEDHMRHRVKQLVKNGQLEFIGGAWSMNDEATTHYQSVIDQFTWGFRKLNETFGTCGRPKIGWQIDPFGHSKETASMMAQFGFDGLFFGRLDYQDKDNRLAQKTMEMIWEGNSVLGSDSDVFTGVLFNLYQAPLGFCFDIMCGDEPIIDDVHSPDYNVDRRVKKFLEYIQFQSAGYRTGDIMLTMGGDFNYQDAHYYFKNLEKLIRYVNKRQEQGSRVNVFYSTPSCYVKSLNEANVTWPTKNDDFFPYASDPHAYWTGYFTSRPNLKYYERRGNNFLQVCKQLGSFAQLGREYLPDLDYLREAMGIMQHHDAITGTEKQHVANDYARILSEAMSKCEELSNVALNKLFKRRHENLPDLKFVSCPLANISQCEISESGNFIVTLYNPLSKVGHYYVRLPVFGNASYEVKSLNKENVSSQLVRIPKALVGLPGRTSTATHELVFRANYVPNLGFLSFYVSRSPSTDGLDDPEPETVDGSQDEYFIENDLVRVGLNGTTGLLTSLRYNGQDFPVSQTFEYYVGESGNNQVFENRSSGAYIFRPKTQNSLNITDRANVTVIRGPVVTEFHQEFAPWVSQVVRLYAGESYVEVEWLVGPIPVDDGYGKEVITRYSTHLASNGVFYTDSNGRQTLKRTRNSRPTWDVKLKEPVAGNYYPLTTDISIRDENVEFTVVVDRAQGGSSLKDGDVEVMIHRRLLHDDAFGVNEALDEEQYGVGLVSRGRHWLVLGNVSDPDWEVRKRTIVQEKVLSPHVFVTDASSVDFDTWFQYSSGYAPLMHELPAAVQILTLEPWKEKTHLLRFEHLVDTGEPIDIDLNLFFTYHVVVSIRETSLGADRWLDEVSRFEWRKETNEVDRETTAKDGTPPSSDPLVIRLSPKQIRTFVCELKELPPMGPTSS